MNLTDLWHKRTKQHQKKMMKYLKYVLNDHFVIICIFLIGAVGYAYAEYLKVIPEENVIFAKWLAVFLLTASVFVGKLATLTVPADAVFLLQKENELDDYLAKAKSHSLLLPGFFLGVASAIVMPLLVAIGVASFKEWFFFFGYLLLLKVMMLDIQHVLLKTKDHRKKKAWRGALMAAVFLTNLLGVFLHPLIGIAAAVLLLLFEQVKAKKKRQQTFYQWNYLITEETSRMKHLLQFFNLFTDIPSVKSSVKRRKYLDGFVKWIKIENKQTFLYLYARAFIRGTEYSGLFIRLSLIGVIMLFLTSGILQVVIAILFLYLTGFQLIPLYYHYDHQLLTALYPITHKNKEQAIQHILFLLLMVQLLVFSVSSLVASGLAEGSLLFVISLLFAIFFCYFYVPKRVKAK